MTKSEKKVYKILKKMGFEILNTGWPDFLCYKENTDEILFIEVKKNRYENISMKNVIKRKKHFSDHVLLKTNELIYYLGINSNVFYWIKRNGLLPNPCEERKGKNNRVYLRCWKKENIDTWINNGCLKLALREYLLINE